MRVANGSAGNRVGYADDAESLETPLCVSSDEIMNNIMIILPMTVIIPGQICPSLGQPAAVVLV
jgi:hypothetical protein